MLVWEPWSLFGFVSFVLSVALAAMVLSKRPDRKQNRAIASFLFLSGMTWLFIRGFVVMETDPLAYDHLWMVFLVTHNLAHLAHFWFLSTLQTPLTAWLRRPWLFRAFIVATFALIAHALVYPQLWLGPLVPSLVIGTWQFTAGTVSGPMLGVWTLMWLYGMTASIHAYVRTNDTTLKAPLRAYVIGSAVHDGSYGITLFLFMVPNPLSGTAAFEVMFFLVYPLANVWYVCWLTYGILRSQLFDIDIRLRRGVQRTTFVALVAAGFLVASEFLETLLPIEGTWMQIAAAALIALAFRPLQVVARRVADRVVPEARTDAMQLEARRREVYMAAIAGAKEDGEVTARESAILAVLRRELEIPDAVAERLHAEAGLAPLAAPSP